MSDTLHHIAIIPDGNRRWAREKNLPTIEGHRRGFNAAVVLAKHARKVGIHTFTLWAFSTENWNRTKEEVGYLMKLYETLLDKNLNEAMTDKVRIVHLGRKDRLPSSLREKIENSEEKTRAFTTHVLNIGIDYGGRDEVVRAIAKIQNSRLASTATQSPSKRAKLKVENLTQEDISQNIDTAGQPYPNPDVIIRTSGEKRLSGFMLWQSQYSEFFFPEVFFPDFTPHLLDKIIKDFDDRNRRFGK